MDGYVGQATWSFEKIEFCHQRLISASHVSENLQIMISSS